jgi:AraC-like DNA-binding protein
LPHGAAHTLASASEGGPALSLDALPSERVGHNAAILHHDGQGEHALLICGGVRFAGPIAHPLLELLPQMLLLHNTYDQEQVQKDIWLGATLAMLGTEALSLRPGSVAMMTRLADLLVLQTIRAWLADEANHPAGWLVALRDPDIGHALTVIHRRAEEPWTVASLAAELNLSRSVFSERFTRLVGMSPMQYVTRWRMHLASSWIREDRLSLSEAAHRLGYSSEAAFSRAFKRHLQVSPGAARWET